MSNPRYKYTYISATSNTQVSARPGRLHGVVGAWPAGGIAYLNDAHTFQQGVLNLNAVSSNTLGKFGAPVTELDVVFNTGLAVAVSSNASVTIIWDDL